MVSTSSFNSLTVTCFIEDSTSYTPLECTFIAERNLVPWIRTWCSNSWTFPVHVSFFKGYRFFDNLRRIWETSLFRLRFIFRVPVSMQSKQILKSQVKRSWKTNLHGYTAVTVSPQQSQNRCFMTSTLRSKRWQILKGKFLAQKCWENRCICDYGYIVI